MGSTNHGTQTITFQYFLEATGAKFGKLLMDIVPPGIYSGGYLTKVTDSEVTLSAFIAQIRNTVHQATVRTAAAATLNASSLDSGAINSATPYIVLRWLFSTSASNYVEIHAIASANAAQTHDVIVGKCIFSGSTLTGFDYAERTFLNVQNLFLRVEESSGLYVRLRAGRIHTSSGYVLVPEQKVGPFSVPSSPNSRIDLVYIDASGSAQILQGTQAVTPSAPSYGGKAVVAEIKLVNGDTSIPADRITDVRTFFPVGGSSLGSVYDSGWFTISANNSYTKNHGLSSTPRIVLVYISDTNVDGTGYFVQGVTGHNADAYTFGTYVKQVTSTQVVIQTNQRLTQITGWVPTSGYAKIIAIQ